jgi:hypothetical protein
MLDFHEVITNCAQIQEKEYHAAATQGIYFPATREYLTIRMVINK